MTTFATDARSDTLDERLRVVLVGSVGSTADLRRERGVELVRALSGADAVGELASHPPEDGERTVVLVGPDGASPRDVEPLLRALRSADPRAVILSCRDPHEANRNGDSRASCVSHRFDGAIDAPIDPAALREAVAVCAEPPSSSADAQANGAPATPAEPSADDAPASPLPNEGAILDAILAGNDPLPVCLASLRDRYSLPGLRYHAADQPASGSEGCLVARRGAVFGSLSCEGCSASSLKEPAALLARWLALREQHRQLRDAALQDPLTAAWNRRFFEHHLDRCLKTAREKRLELSLLVVDLDDFKQYNDRFGHAAGDEILIETVRLLQSVIRPTDRVCRLGGDEFAVIFFEPDGPREGGLAHPTLAQITARFQRQICDHRFPKLGDHAPGPLTVSGGLATFPWDGADADSLLDHADRLALASKRLGKSAILFGVGARRCDELRAQGLDPHAAPPPAEPPPRSR